MIEVELESGADWTLTHRIAGPNRLTVEILSEDERALDQVSWVVASYTAPQGFRATRSRRRELGALVEIEGIDAPSVQVKLSDGEKTLASMTGSFVDGRLHLRIPLGGESFLLSVVDRDREPVAGVRVLVNDPRDPNFLLFGATNGLGQCLLSGVPMREILVNLQHPTKGNHFGLRCDASSGRAEVMLDGSAELDLRFRDGDVPIPSVSCGIVDFGGRQMIQESVADETGRVLIQNLGRDRYRLSAWKNGCWPIRFEAEATEEAPPTTIQIRRLGDLEIEVVASSGLPVSELDLELTSEELGEAVADWIADGRVTSSGLVTDLRGRILVEGLPHGSYHWMVNIPDETLQGELIVKPGTRTMHRIALP
jgi:hypothetical protein